MIPIKHPKVKIQKSNPACGTLRSITNIQLRNMAIVRPLEDKRHNKQGASVLNITNIARQHLFLFKIILIILSDNIYDDKKIKQFFSGSSREIIGSSELDK